MRKSKNRYFYHIFVSPVDAPGPITLNVVWIEREFLYLSQGMQRQEAQLSQRDRSTLCVI